MSEPFLAQINVFAFGFAPTGFAACDGQTLTIAQNTALFSLLGTNFGGDGRTTSGLPNFQESAPVHVGQGPGLSPCQVGQTGGAASVSLNLSQLPAHNHAVGCQTASGAASPVGAV